MLKVSKTSEDPYYLQIKDALRAQIVSGRLRPGNCLPDERSMAVELKVSRKTTRRALAELTREGLLRRVRGRGTYVRDSVGRRQLQRDCVLVVSQWSPFSFPFFGKIIESVTRAADEAGGFTAMECINSSSDDYIAKVLRHEPLKGIVLVGVTDENLLKQSLRLKMPLVLVDGYQSSKNPFFDWVTYDAEPGVHGAAKYLQVLGHRQIVFLGTENSKGSNLARLRGYTRAMEESGLRPNATLISAYTPESAYAATTRLLNESAPPTAIVCMSDEHAIGALEAIKDFGWTVPKDISIVGVGDVGYFTAPRLSTVRVPMQQMGLIALKMLEMRVAHPTAPIQCVTTNVEWVARNSCAVPRLRQ
jgi:DNA-binding LacI/PurR family transcriptional regulator